MNLLDKSASEVISLLEYKCFSEKAFCSPQCTVIFYCAKLLNQNETAEVSVCCERLSGVLCSSEASSEGEVQPLTVCSVCLPRCAVLYSPVAVPVWFYVSHLFV